MSVEVLGWAQLKGLTLSRSSSVPVRCGLACREQMSRVQGKLDTLSRENELLKEGRAQDPGRPPPAACEDPLAEQVQACSPVQGTVGRLAQHREPEHTWQQA